MSRLLALAALLLSASVAAAVAAAEPAIAHIAHHSLVPPFVNDWWQEGIPHWELGGDAVVTRRFVRLTPDLQSRFGYVYNTQPNDNVHWEARLSIISRFRRTAQADGIALWLVADPYRGEAGVGPVFGMKSAFDGIGVLLDTYDNDGNRDNPSISLISNNGAEREWGVGKDMSTDSRHRCTFDFRTNSGQATEIVVSYNNRKLVVQARNPERSANFVTCFEVAQFAGLQAGKNYFFGMTATTGHVSDNHDIASFFLKPLGESIGDVNIPLEHFDHSKEDSDKSFHSEQKRARPRWSERSNEE